jgi:SAM-dependent methyltransferase
MHKNFIELLKEQIPSDYSNQVTSDYYIDRIFERVKLEFPQILDIGCGVGNSLDKFKERHSNVNWFGLDIEDSPEVNSRIRTDGNFYTFDGINIPFENSFFDLIYSNQVFEHVRYPSQLLKEINRSLKSQGYFMGSTSYLEPYHSFSYWNYTPYGFKELLEEANFKVVEIRPSIDALTLILRRGMGNPKFFSSWWKKESPLNSLITIFGKITGRDRVTINSLKLLFCGQFCFLAQKQ